MSVPGLVKLGTPVLHANPFGTYGELKPALILLYEADLTFCVNPSMFLNMPHIEGHAQPFNENAHGVF